MLCSCKANPSSPNTHVEVSLTKILNPQIAHVEELAPCMTASTISVRMCVSECVCEWVNLTSVVRRCRNAGP